MKLPQGLCLTSTYCVPPHAIMQGCSIGSFGLAIAIDEEGQDDRVAKRRDKSLASVGVEVFRIPAATILDDVEAAMKPIFAAMNARYRDKETARRVHQSKYGSKPRRTRPARRDDRK